MWRAELFGPSGVGKTALFDRVAWGLGGVRDTSRHSLPLSHFGLVDVLVSAKGAPRLVPRWYEYVLRGIHYDAFLQEQDRQGVWLFDESLCQAALLLHRLDVPEWRAFVEQIPVEGRVAFYYEATPAQIVHRGAGRAKGGLSLEVARSDLGACEVIVANIKSRGVRVVRLQGLEIEPLAARVRSVLEVYDGPR